MRSDKKVLKVLEDWLTASSYKVRYESGSFNPGSCVLKGMRILVVNKHYTSEGKIRALFELSQQLGDLLPLPEEVANFLNISEDNQESIS